MDPSNMNPDGFDIKQIVDQLQKQACKTENHEEGGNENPESTDDNIQSTGDASGSVIHSAQEITQDKLSLGVEEFAKKAQCLNPNLHNSLTYYIDSNIGDFTEKDYKYLVELSRQFDAEEYCISNSAITTSTLYRIKFGKILRKLKELHKKFENGNWEDFADKHFGISKETRTLYMRISRIKGVENYAFLGVERLRRITEVLNKLKITDDDQLAGLFNRFSVKVDIDLPVKDFKKTIDELLKKANMKPDKTPPVQAKEEGDNPESKEDEGSSDTPPPSSENGTKTKGTSGKKDKLNQESLNRGIHKLIESVDTFFELEFGEDVLSVEIIDNFQSKLTELNDKLETLKEKITNI